TSKGRLCYNGIAQMQGLCFMYHDSSMVYEAGLMIGRPAKVSDNVRGTGGATDDDFASVTAVRRVVPDVNSDFDLAGRFNDNSSASKLNVVVTHHAYAWGTVPNRKFLMVEYGIKNNGTATLDSLY